MEKQHITKILLQLNNNPHLFKNKNINFETGLTSTDLNKIKKIVKDEKLVNINKDDYFVTEKGFNFIKSNPIEKWKREPYKYRYETNLEYLKLEKTPSTVTRAINVLSQYFLENTPLKENSVEYNILLEISSDNEDLKILKDDIEKFILSSRKIKVSDYFNIYLKAPYGLTKSLASILLMEILAKHKDEILIYKNSEIQLYFNNITLENIIGSPERHEIKKTVLKDIPLLYEISKTLVSEPTYNILDITKCLISLIKSLDSFTLNTNKLSSKTLKLRNTVLSADDPIRLFCKDLPMLLCKNEIENCTEDFIKEFEKCTNELKNRYNSLLQELTGFVLESFNSSSRNDLSTRFLKIHGFLNSQELIVLSNNIVDNSVSNKLWIERIAICVNKSLAPEDWTDIDTANFKISIKQFANIFLKIEEIVLNFDECSENLKRLSLEFHSTTKNIITVLTKKFQKEQQKLYKNVISNI